MKKTGSSVKLLKAMRSLKLDTADALLSWAKNNLKNLGPREAQASAERLLEEVLGVERSFLFLNGKKEVSKLLARRYRSLIKKRRQHIPVAYLLRKAYFWNEVLEVNPSCLIPRPETEILVQSFIEHSGFGKNSRFSFLDLGCGSGIIGIALARYFPYSEVTFCDISKAALGVTKKNAARYGLLNRSCFIESNGFAFWKASKQRWDAVLSNPPYVADEDLKRLEPELKWEPEIALRGGKEGLDFYIQISQEAKKFLKPGGQLVFEMGAGQCAKIKKLIINQGYKTPQIFKDYLNIDRVLMTRV